jgi:tRNA(Ile)-lysidine synthase
VSRAGRGPRLLRGLEAAARSLDLPGRRIAVAVSGGVDSVSLLAGLVELSDRLHLTLSVAHVHHGLRGEEADADAAFVRGRAEAHGLPVAVERVDPRAAVAAAPSSRTRPTVQEAARRLRAEALERLAAGLGAERIATAHTADDQAETVLLRLLRGTGPSGLAGIPPRTGIVVRPLLRTTRAELLAYAAARGLDWREDPSNASPRYARGRLRHGWLPGLREAFNPRLLRAVGDLAEAMQDEAAWIGGWVDAEARRRFQPATGEGAILHIEAKDWDPETVPDALARRLARQALHQAGAGRDVTRAHLDRIVAFLRRGRPGRSIELPGGLRLVRGPRGFRLDRVTVASPGPC